MVVVVIIARFWKLVIVFYKSSTGDDICSSTSDLCTSGIHDEPLFDQFISTFSADPPSAASDLQTPGVLSDVSSKKKSDSDHVQSSTFTHERLDDEASIEADDLDVASGGDYILATILADGQYKGESVFAGAVDGASG